MKFFFLFLSMAFVLAACVKEKTPTSMKITKIRVIDFPMTDSTGATWDVGSGAELYVQIKDESGNTVFDSPGYLPDAPDNTTINYTPDSSVDIDCPTCQYTLYLYDYDDLDADDLVGNLSFMPFPEGSNPKNDEIKAVYFSGNNVAFEFDFTYVY